MQPLKPSPQTEADGVGGRPLIASFIPSQPIGNLGRPVNKSPSGFDGKRFKITGRIEMYKGKPEIRINSASQVELE